MKDKVSQYNQPNTTSGEFVPPNYYQYNVDSVELKTFKKEPYKCPVCNGKGIVQAGFYSYPSSVGTYITTTIVPEKCRSCGGSGVLWG